MCLIDMCSSTFVFSVNKFKIWIIMNRNNSIQNMKWLRMSQPAEAASASPVTVVYLLIYFPIYIILSL